MILFVGQVGTDMMGREAFQEVDYRAMFAPLAKWAVEVNRVERLPEIVSRAWAAALAGRPGPVVLALPDREDTGRAELRQLLVQLRDGDAEVPGRLTGVGLAVVEQALEPAAWPFLLHLRREKGHRGPPSRPSR